MSNDNLREIEAVDASPITETEEEFSDEPVYQVQLEDDDFDPDDAEDEDEDEDDFDDDDEEEEEN